LPNLGELARGKSKHRPRNDPKLYGGPYAFIQTAEVRASGGRIRRYSQTYNELGLAQSRLWPKGTLCITIAANIAETGILEFDACFPDSVVGLLVEGNPALARYVELYLRSVKDRLDRLAPATAQKNINLEILEQLEIPVPPDHLVERVVSAIERGLSIAEQVHIEVAASFKRANRLKEAQLMKAFSTRCNSSHEPFSNPRPRRSA
jgi:type I restriction enzyme S subunit